MFLMHKQTHNLIEILSMEDLFDPFAESVLARSHAGEEMQDPERFMKAELLFPSGEDLPRYWIDPDYRGLHIVHPSTASVV